MLIKIATGITANIAILDVLQPEVLALASELNAVGSSAALSIATTKSDTITLMSSGMLYPLYFLRQMIAQITIVTPV
jgi:hypothetical protein